MLFKDYMFKARLPLLNSALNAYALREKTIAKNIANATTEGYTPQKVRFEEFFKNEGSGANQVIQTDYNHMSVNGTENNMVKPEVYEEEVPENQQYFAGESHVNIDKEMSELAQNQIKFRFASRMVKRYFSGLNTAITGFRE